MKYIFSIFILLVISLSFQNCTKDPETITKTIMVHDTLVVTVHDTISLHDTLVIDHIINDTATYFFIVRHAEKGSGSNPSLTTEGKERADELARVLGSVELNAAFSTNYKRTKETAKPTADAQNVAIQTYSTNKKLMRDVLANELYRNVLVVGHSNTTPDLVNLLLGKNEFPDLGEKDFDNLYIVAYFNEEKAEVFPLKYGK